MEIRVIASRQVFEESLRSARDVGRTGTIPGLAAVLDAGFAGRLAEAWDAVEEALRQGFEHGREAARSYLDSALEKVEKILAQAGAKSRELHHALLERLHTYVQSFTMGALARVSPSVQVGGRPLVLARVQIAHTVILTGSLKTSLTEVFALTSTGEITITADYAAVDR